MFKEKGRRAGIVSNKGFSLVEVLVCIAILTVISIPVLTGMRTAARLNFDANSTQRLTVYAQQELERIKSLPAQEYAAYLASQGGHSHEIIDDSVYPEVFARAQSVQASFSEVGSLDPAALKELFTPFYCELENIEISGSEYTMRAIFEPAPYSRENGTGQYFAQDINVSLMTDMEEADASRFPVISDEINQYDGNGSGTSAVVSNIKTRLEAMGTAAAEEEIAKGMKKETEVEISTNAAGGEVNVICDVTYSYGTVELYYRVYNGTYKYSPTKAEVDAGAVTGVSAGEQSGGNVFLFARAFQDTAFAAEESAHCINTISIINHSSVDMPVNVYLVRGFQTDITGTHKMDYNFDSVLLNGTEYLLGDTSGESSVGEGRFYTNIKSKNWNRCGLISSEDSENEKIVGRGEYKTRCYDVTIELIEEAADGSREVKARIESTKIER